MTTEEAVEVEQDAWAMRPGLGKALLRGAIAGAIISFVSILVGILALDVQWQSAVAIGLFIGFWGGLGFGIMLSGVVWLSFHEEEMAQETGIEHPVEDRGAVSADTVDADTA